MCVGVCLERYVVNLNIIVFEFESNLKNDGLRKGKGAGQRQVDQIGARAVHSWYRPLYAGLQLYGKDWKKIEALVATRNGAQIRSHAQKYFIKTKKEDEPDAEHSPELLSPVTQLPASDSDNYSYFLSKM